MMGILAVLTSMIVVIYIIGVVVIANAINSVLK